ncbi:hypothetical protein C8R44DRAFT_754001 [Mycena epipterygia]|nr:hypothetical protein C8R44DRAFT_754001 [Mycena epipterygia]
MHRAEVATDVASTVVRSAGKGSVGTIMSTGNGTRKVDAHRRVANAASVGTRRSGDEPEAAGERKRAETGYAIEGKRARSAASEKKGSSEKERINHENHEIDEGKGTDKLEEAELGLEKMPPSLLRAPLLRAPLRPGGEGTQDRHLGGENLKRGRWRNALNSTKSTQE